MVEPGCLIVKKDVGGSSEDPGYLVAALSPTAVSSCWGVENSRLGRTRFRLQWRRRVRCVGGVGDLGGASVPHDDVFVS